MPPMDVKIDPSDLTALIAAFNTTVPLPPPSAGIPANVLHEFTDAIDEFKKIIEKSNDRNHARPNIVFFGFLYGIFSG